jgi:hypothetical protein
MELEQPTFQIITVFYLSLFKLARLVRKDLLVHKVQLALRERQAQLVRRVLLDHRDPKVHKEILAQLALRVLLDRKDRQDLKAFRVILVQLERQVQLVQQA